MKLKIFLIGTIWLLAFHTTLAQQWVRVYGDSLNTLVYSLSQQYDKGFLFSGSEYDNSYFAKGLLFKTDINP